MPDKNFTDIREVRANAEQGIDDRPSDSAIAVTACRAHRRVRGILIWVVRSLLKIALPDSRLNAKSATACREVVNP